MTTITTNSEATVITQHAEILVCNNGGLYQKKPLAESLVPFANDFCDGGHPSEEVREFYGFFSDYFKDFEGFRPRNFGWTVKTVHDWIEEKSAWLSTPEAKEQLAREDQEMYIRWIDSDINEAIENAEKTNSLIFTSFVKGHGYVTDYKPIQLERISQRVQAHNKKVIELKMMTQYRPATFTLGEVMFKKSA